MSASHRLLPGFKGYFTRSPNPRNFAFFRSSSLLHFSPVGAPRSPGLHISPSGLFMPRNQSRGGYREKRWQERPQYHPQSSSTRDTLPETADTATNKLSSLYIAGNVRHARFQVPNVHSGSLVPPDRSLIKAWRPKSYGSTSGTTPQAENQSAEQFGGDIKENGGKAAAAERIDAVSNKVVDVSLLENFIVDDSSCSRAEIRATFYPKFENEKSDQELRTFLIRNGLSILFKEGPAAYKAYYLRQMKIWGTSAAKQRELSKMLDEWAVYIQKKCGRKQGSSSTYLSEAEPFLEQYAKRSLHNQALIGSAGNVVKTEDFIAVIEDGRDEEGDLETEKELVPSIHTTPAKETVPKAEGLIVFFPGIPGCAKSALCKELMNTPGGLGDDRLLCCLMGDLVKGRYWQKVSDERKRRPYSIMLADKNAPNEEILRSKTCVEELEHLQFQSYLILKIEDMCRRTRASAVPVIPDSEGNDSNPFSLDALAVFMFRVLQRTNHLGNLDGASPNVGYVLLMFYHLYSGKSRKEFEGELVDRFDSVVKMPLLKPDRSPLPDVLKSTLEEGINHYSRHTNRHGRMESTKGSYAAEWAKWERKLRETLFGNAEYLNFIQVPFKDCVSRTLEQLRSKVEGDYMAPTTEKQKLGSIVFAAVSVPVKEILGILDKLSASSPEVHSFFKDKHLENALSRAHVTLAHKRAHGVAAVASYGVFAHWKVPVCLTAFLLSEKLAAFEAALGTVDGEQVSSRNEWPHLTLWTADGVAPNEANTLPQLHSEGKATRVDLKPPVAASGTIEFF